MKSTMSAFAMVLALGFLLGGCSVSQQIYIQDASVTAPPLHLPVRISEDSIPHHIVLTPMLAVGKSASLSGTLSGHSPVNMKGVYQVDTLWNSNGTVEFSPKSNGSGYKGTNLHLSTTRVVAGMAVDVILGRSIALSGGLLYTSNEGEDAWGGHCGIGIFGGSPKVGYRFDFGLLFTPGWYSVRTAVETVYDPIFGSEYTRTVFYEDKSVSTGMGWYIGMTLNSRNPSWAVRPFVNILVAKQELFSFYPKNPLAAITVNEALPVTVDNKAQSGLMSVSVAPGLSIPLGDSERLLVGARWLAFPDVLNGDDTSIGGGNIVMGFVQFDITP
jgi:hypothetical protein